MCAILRAYEACGVTNSFAMSAKALPETKALLENCRRKGGGSRSADVRAHLRQSARGVPSLTFPTISRGAGRRLGSGQMGPG